MPANTLNLISDIRAGKSIGIIRYVSTTPRAYQMYGRESGITMGQHLDEFDHYKDDQGRSFDEAVLNGLFSETMSLMHPPPKPKAQNMDGPKSNKVDIEDYLARLKSRHIVESKQRMTENPEYKHLVKKNAPEASKKRKTGPESSYMQAQNAMVLKDNENGKAPSAQRLTTDNSNGARKHPLTRARPKT